MVARSKNRFHLDINGLPQGRIEAELRCNPEDLGLEEETLAISGKIPVKLSIYRAGHDVDVTASVSFVCVLVCSRCLKEYEASFAEHFTSFYRRPLEGALPGEVEISDEDAMTYFYEDEMIDLTPAVRDAMLLAVPMRPLCADDCKGLCSVCGEDLNVGKCSCSTEITDARWDALKKFKQS
jgi:uncharacterized protein